MLVANADTQFDKLDSLSLSIHKPSLTEAIYVNQVFNIEKPLSNPKSPKISIIIVAYNEKDDLIALLTSVDKQRDSETEVILVDNGLDASVVCEAKLFNVVYIKSKKNTGCTCGRNIGASFAQGQTLVFLDADGDISSDLVQAIKVKMVGDVVALRGKVLLKSSECGMMPKHYDLGDVSFECYTNCEGISAWNAELFKAAGGFEEGVYAHEGVILNYRLIELFGVERSAFKYEPTIILYHDFCQDQAHLLNKAKVRVLIKERMKLRYPFLQSFIDEYESDFKKYRPKSKQYHKFESDLLKIKNAIKKEIKKESSASSVLRDGFPEKPNFTVVVICQDSGKSLLESLQSIWSQTLQAIEIIVVDDASTDLKTISILESIQNKIKVVRLRVRSGIAHACNVGIGLSKSEYVLCIERADCIYPTYLEKSKNVFELSSEIGVVSCWAQCGDNTNVWKAKDRLRMDDGLISMPLHRASCFKKQIWRNLVSGFDSDLSGFESWDFWLCALEQGVSVRVIPEVLYCNHSVPDFSGSIENSNCSKEIFTRFIKKHEAAFSENVVKVVSQQKLLIHELSSGSRSGLSTRNGYVPFLVNLSGGTNNIPQDTSRSASHVNQYGRIRKLITRMLSSVGGVERGQHGKVSI